MSAKVTKEMLGIIEQIQDVITNSKKIIITSHQNPDGDAIGSTLAMYNYLKSLSKDVRVILHSPVPYNLLFLPGAREIIQYETSQDDFILESDTIFVIDLNDVARTNSMAEILLQSNAFKIIIDHHIDTKEYAKINLVDTDATSAGELVYRALKSNPNFKLTKEISECLYSAIMTDTGCFRFPRTDGEIHRIIGELIDNKADPVELFENIYNIKPERVVKLLGEAFSGLETYFDGKLCVLTLSRKNFITAQAKNEDVEDIVEQALTIDGVQAGVLFSQNLETEEIRISFRSKGELSVRDIAVKFNGGGHFHAAGARIFDTPIDTAKKIIIEEFKKIFE